MAGSGIGCHSAEFASMVVQVKCVGLIALKPSSHVIVWLSPSINDEAESEMVPLVGAIKALHSGTEGSTKCRMH